MRQLCYYVGTSIDGYIAGPGGEYDFFEPSPELIGSLVEELPEVIPTHVREALGMGDPPNARWDTVVMGRGTYEPALDVGVTSPYAHMRQVVVSTTVAADVDGAVEVVRADPLACVRALKAEPSDLGVWLAGGGVLAAELLPEIDEIVVKQYPVVAGGGRPMFAGRFDPTSFVLIDQRSFDDGTLVRSFARR